MFDMFNNYWIIILSIIIILAVCKKIYYMNKPFDHENFINKYNNKNKLKNKFNNINLHEEISKITNYYVGIN